MRLANRGLTQLSTADLKELLRAVHRDVLPCPVTPIGLGLAGLLRLQDDVDHLRDLDRRATVAVLTAVIAERSPR